jgi:hypothetical protein
LIGKGGAVAKRKEFVVVHVAQGELEANVMKSHLECEGIPVVMQFESVGRVFGLTVDGLGEIKILVPPELADEAKKIIEPKEISQTEE